MLRQGMEARQGGDALAAPCAARQPGPEGGRQNLSVKKRANVISSGVVIAAPLFLVNFVSGSVAILFPFDYVGIWGHHGPEFSESGGPKWLFPWLS